MDPLSHPPRPPAPQGVQSQLNENTYSNTGDDDGCEMYEFVEKFQVPEAEGGLVRTEPTGDGQHHMPQPQKSPQPTKTMDTDDNKDSTAVAIDLCDEDNSVRASIEESWCARG